MWKERLTSIYAGCVFEQPVNPSDLEDLQSNLEPEIPSDLRSLLEETDGLGFQIVVDPNIDPEEGVITTGLVSSVQDIWDDTSTYRSFGAAFNDFIVFGSMPNGDFLAYCFVGPGEDPDVWVISHENHNDRYPFASSLDEALRIILECAE